MKCAKAGSGKRGLVLKQGLALFRRRERRSFLSLPVPPSVSFLARVPQGLSKLFWCRERAGEVWPPEEKHTGERERSNRRLFLGGVWGLPKEAEKSSP
jgi:hypothetical protein